MDTNFQRDTLSPCIGWGISWKNSMFLLTRTELHPISLSLGSECSSPLQPAHVTQYFPQPTHFDHKYRDTIFLGNIAMLSQHRRHNLNTNHRETHQTHIKREFSSPPQSALHNSQAFHPYSRICHSWFIAMFLRNVSRGSPCVAPQHLRNEPYPSVWPVFIACLSKTLEQSCGCVDTAQFTSVMDQCERTPANVWIRLMSTVSVKMKEGFIWCCFHSLSEGCFKDTSYALWSGNHLPFAPDRMHSCHSVTFILFLFSLTLTFCCGVMEWYCNIDIQNREKENLYGILQITYKEERYLWRERKTASSWDIGSQQKNGLTVVIVQA
jgi:hypothetical protein